MLADALFFMLFFGGGKRAEPAPPWHELPPPPPPPPAPFPSPAPTTLPPFPSGWCYDEPPPQEVKDRAWELLPSLWAKGAGATQGPELVGGRWITFKAEMMGTKRGVTAFRAQGCGSPAPSSSSSQPSTPAQPPTVPAVVVQPIVPPHIVTPPAYVPVSQPPAVLPAPAGSNPYGGTMSTAQVQATVNSMGYTPALVVDGKYGPATTAGVKWAQGQLNLGGHVPVLVLDGKAGPQTQAAMQEWGHAPPVVPASAPAQPAPSAPLVLMSPKQVQHAVNVMGYSPALVEDGKIGPKSVAGIKWAQQHMNAMGWHPALAIDGIAGPLTQAAFEGQQTA